MPTKPLTKSDKILFVICLVFVLPGAGIIRYLDTTSTLWKIDLAAIVTVAALIGLATGLYYFGRLFRKINPRKDILYKLLNAEFGAICLDALIIIVPFIVKRPSWFFPALWIITLAGVLFFLVAAFVSGMMKKNVIVIQQRSSDIAN